MKLLTENVSASASTPARSYTATVVNSGPRPDVPARTSADHEVTFETVDQARREHPAWKLLNSPNSPLAVSFLHRVFIDANAGCLPRTTLVGELDDELYSLRRRGHQFPRSAGAYLDEWADSKHQWLRKTYQPGSDEPHFDITPAAAKAVATITTMTKPADDQFVGTESRLNLIVDLLREMVYGSSTDRNERLAELHRRRAELDERIAREEQGHAVVLDRVEQRERYQQFADMARSIMGDFRQLEENFRQLDRRTREQIASWNGPKGELLETIFDRRLGIAESDQGRSFRAFHDLLLSADRQAELTELLSRLHESTDIDGLDRRLAAVHFDWIEASERAQETVRRLSEQLRRFLDDRVYTEDRRVLELIRCIESKALQLRNAGIEPPPGVMFDDPRVDIRLPMERPLHRHRSAAPLARAAIVEGAPDMSGPAITGLVFVDEATLAAKVLAALAGRDRVTLTEVVAGSPIEQGLAELISYFGLRLEGVDIVFDDTVRCSVPMHDDVNGNHRHVDLPEVTFIKHAQEDE